MIHGTENNWYKWYYNDSEFFTNRTDKDEVFRSYLSKYTGPIHDFRIESAKAAASTLDHYPDLKPVIFFSGGSDSEVILRSYLNIGSKPDVVVVRYENDYNKKDVDDAIEISKCLNVDIKILDMNLQHYYENEATEIADIAQIDRPRMLPSLKYADLIGDGLPIIGHSDVRWFQPKDHRYKKQWLGQCHEYECGPDKYIQAKNRPAIYQWFRWTPGLMLSYTKMPWFQRLIQGGYPGEDEIDNTKIIGFSEQYGELLPRKKLTGFENIETIIKEFEEHLFFKNRGLIYRGECKRTLSQMWAEITGNTYKFTIGKDNTDK
jgi:hypothetical protein